MAPLTDSQTTQTVRLDQMLESAVVLSWDELMPNSTSGLIHIEYQSGADGSLDFLKIWASTIWGQWKLICEFWVRPLWDHAAGVRFGSEFHSVDFARTLELVVGKDDKSAILPNLHGLLQVSPPTAVERSDAGVMIREVLDHHGAPTMEPHIAA